MKRLFLLLLLTVLPVFSATWYVDSTATGSANGTSWANAWTALSQITQSALAADDVVLIKNGPYDEQYILTKGGTSAAHRITYLGTGSTRPIVQRGFYANNVDYVAVVNIEFTQPTTAYLFSSIYLLGDTATSTGCDGWLIEDNYIHDTARAGVEFHNGNHKGNIVRHNLFSNLGGTSGGSGSGGNAVELHGDNSLIEYNSVLRSNDRCRAFGTKVIVRNNYWGYTDSSLYPNSSPYPFHTDGFQSYGSVPLTQFIYEGNYDIDNTDSVGGTNAHGFLVQDTSNVNYNWHIKRFNELIRPGGGSASWQNVSHVYNYNDTMIAVAHGASSAFYSAQTYTYPSSFTPATSDLADVRNLTWSFCSNCRNPGGIISSLPTNFTSAAEHAYNVGPQVVLPVGASPANLPNVDPLFVDGTGVAGHDDYHLQTGSPLKAAGAPIVLAVGSGASSTSLTVSNAQRLCDGWGLVEADWIKIGSGAYVQISSINYSTNVVTLSAARTWSTGDGVYVKGSEDIGALPYSYAVPFTVTLVNSGIPTGAVTFTTTINNPDAVRYVEYLVDGLPIGLSYDAASNYPQSWTSDGQVHVIEVRAAKKWASDTPTQSSIYSLSGALAPVITTNPSNQVVPTGSTVTFTAAVSGSPTPTWQWSKNATPIGGATSASLVLSGVTAADNGSYTATATNASGSATTSAASLTVLDPVTATPATPVITGIIP